MGGVNLFESAALRKVSGPVIRPGGFELTERGLACCRLVPGDRVLDVGCGTGAVVDYLLRRHGLAALGIDFSMALLKEGMQTFAGPRLVRGLAEQIPVIDGCFNAVVCECMLSLCGDPARALREIHRVLQPGGCLILTDVYARGAAATVCAGDSSVNSCLRGAVARSTVEDRINASGLDLLLWEDHSPLLTQLMARLVWAYGSLEAFWSAAGGTCEAVLSSARGARCGSRPGYYLLVARKNNSKGSKSVFQGQYC